LTSIVNAIEMDGVSKDFASPVRGPAARALEAVTLQVGVGEVVGLLGPNGSGKTTLLKIVLGLLAPSAGSCRVFGVPSERVEARRGVGYLPEAPDFSPHLTGYELVCYHARLGAVPARTLRATVESAITRVGLTGAMHRRVGTYSQGMRQRLGLAQALVPDPRLLVLDEPVAGVDPVGAAEFCRLVGQFKAQGRTVLFSSHLLGQVERVCDRVVVLDRGRLVLQGRVEELTGRRGRMALLVDPLPAALLAELRTWLQARGAGLHGVEQPRAELDRVFLEAVGHPEAGGP
jgi:ABC-2 type transport system ATP-binding protein